MSLSLTVRKAMDAYWRTMEPSDIGNGNEIFLLAAEKPMLESILEYTHGNQTMAAKILGVNRGTFRTKLKKYKIVK